MLYTRKTEKSSKDQNPVYSSESHRYLINSLLVIVGVFLTAIPAFGQYYNPNQNNPLRQNAFRQEIARLDISVERAGALPLPIKMVPRVQRGDIIRVRMIDQPINGIPNNLITYQP